MKKIFFALVLCSLIFMGASCDQQQPAEPEKTQEQKQTQEQPKTEGKEWMTIQEAKAPADDKMERWAEDAVVEKTFQSKVNEEGKSKAWYFYYCSPSQNKQKYVTVKKEKVVSVTDQDECTYDQQGGEALKMDSPEIYALAEDEINKFKKDYPDAYVIISLLRYNGGDYHYLWTVEAFPDKSTYRPTVEVLLDDDGNVVNVKKKPE